MCRSAMAVAFSSSGDNVIARQIAYSHPSFTNIAEEFEVSSTATWIQEHNFRRVCTTLVYTAYYDQQK